MLAARIKGRYIPNQHGAWAMLVVPFLFGMISGGIVLQHALLFVFWLAAYLFSYPFLQWVKTRKLQIYRDPMILYGSIAVLSGLLLAVAAPQLLKWVPLFILPFIINCYFARINRERAFFNDLIAVLMFSVMALVSHELGGGGNFATAVELFILSVLYFTGTIFYVKTVIREKNNKRFYWYSILYHLIVAISMLIWYPPLVAASFVFLFIRALWSPRVKMTVKRIGILEFSYAVIITVTVFVSYGFA